AEIARLKTREDWIGRQSLVRNKLTDIVGPFPEKQRLNARVTGEIKKDGYRIEKIIFESFPGFYVTGCLYVPEKIRGKAPAVLNVIGHNQESFRNELYQLINTNLAKKGILVFAIDPPGQGEHVQYYDPAVKFSSVGYSVVEHCYFGNQCFLTGSSCAKYFIWDGMRAIDYLISRKDVDPERIGVTGFSGGGTITTYISAFDERVRVSVPCSWSTASRRQFETKGAQDAESEFYRGLAEGITLEDLLEVRAPKPTLLTAVSRDEYLTLQGARDAYAESKKAFDLLGSPENIQIVEDDSKHWMTLKIRTTIYAFFMKHFNIPGEPSESNAEILSQEELTVTPTGQASTFLGGDMIFDVNRKEAEKLLEGLERSRNDIDRHLVSVGEKAKAVSGYHSPGNQTASPFINGKYRRSGYTVGKYAIRGEGDYAIPFLLFMPDDEAKQHHAIVYLHPGGKSVDAEPGGEIEKLVKMGYVVAAPDLLGTGEILNTASREIAPGYTAVSIGRSVVGIQAGDIIRIVNCLKGWPGVNPEKIGAIGIDGMCIPLVHAAAFDQSINNMILSGSIISFRSIVMNRIFKIGLITREGGGYWHPYEVEFNWGVAGALTAYDIPDLIGCIAPRKVVLAGIRDHMLEPAQKELIDSELAFPIAAYSSKKVSDNIKIVPSYGDARSLIEWGFQ
ncbi:MAG TPA: alpha/beta hydrolase family protein, partial [Cyclobacteriaceae bacterium]|nr:alpha/beta hydrolase family protein [Cyclobacteriaceae bacterium]